MTPRSSDLQFGLRLRAVKNSIKRRLARSPEARIVAERLEPGTDRYDRLLAIIASQTAEKLPFPKNAAVAFSPLWQVLRMKRVRMAPH
jgi:hypothetical protein